MMSLETIQTMNQAAAIEAALEGGYPFTVEASDYVPDGWQRVNLKDENDQRGIYLGEPALTVKQFVYRLKPGLSYAIVEVEQFQVKIAVFERV